MRAQAENVPCSRQSYLPHFRLKGACFHPRDLFAVQEDVVDLVQGKACHLVGRIKGDKVLDFTLEVRHRYLIQSQFWGQIVSVAAAASDAACSVALFLTMEIASSVARFLGPNAPVNRRDASTSKPVILGVLPLGMTVRGLGISSNKACSRDLGRLGRPFRALVMSSMGLMKSSARPRGRRGSSREPLMGAEQGKMASQLIHQGPPSTVEPQQPVFF